MRCSSKAGQGLSGLQSQSQSDGSGGYEMASSTVQVMCVQASSTDNLEVSGEYRRFDNPLYTHAHHVYESIL